MLRNKKTTTTTGSNNNKRNNNKNKWILKRGSNNKNNESINDNSSSCNDYYYNESSNNSYHNHNDDTTNNQSENNNSNIIISNNNNNNNNTSNSTDYNNNNSNKDTSSSSKMMFLSSSSSSNNNSNILPNSNYNENYSYNTSRNNNNNNNNNMSSTNSSSLNASFLSRWTDPENNNNNTSSSFGNTTLLGDLQHIIKDDYYNNNTISSSTLPIYPHRVWKVSDTRVPIYNNNCNNNTSLSIWPKKPTYSIVITDHTTPPSIIAIRIAECLRKRSIAVEYDDEAALANCYTIDRCQFTIYLWKYSSNCNNNDYQQQQNHHHDLLVECVKISGNSITFCNTIKAIFDAAECLDSGIDRRLSFYQSSPIEYPRLNINNNTTNNKTKLLLPLSNNNNNNNNDNDTIMIECIENIFTLLCKEQYDIQMHGMYQLVCITDIHSSTNPLLASQIILGQIYKTNVLLYQVHTIIFNLIIDRKLPIEYNNNEPLFQPTTTTNDENDIEEEKEIITNMIDSFDIMSPAPKQSSSSSLSQTINRSFEYLDDRHASQMRALALRAVTNALIVYLHNNNKEQQQTTLGISNVEQLISVLIDDLHGSIRPATLFDTTRLATSHEAVLAVKIIGLLSLLNEDVKNLLKINETYIDALEKAASIGRSTHTILSKEAKYTYQLLTEEDRSC